MRIISVTSASVLSILLFASPLSAQPRWTAEVRGGVNAALEEFTGVDLKIRPGFEMGVGLSSRGSARAVSTPTSKLKTRTRETSSRTPRTPWVSKWGVGWTSR